MKTGYLVEEISKEDSTAAKCKAFSVGDLDVCRPTVDSLKMTALMIVVKC